MAFKTRTRRAYLGTILCTFLHSAALAAAEESSPRSCDSYREYVTTYNYLLDKKTLAFTKDQASVTAFRVAKGCDGAAGRFIRVFDLLINAKLTLQQSSEIAEEISWLDSESAETFAEIFKVAFLEKYLDLTLSDAIQLARSLSSDAAGASGPARKEFEKLVQFCLAKTGLGLSKPDCAKLSLQLVKLDERDSNKYVATAFVDLIEFLRSDNDGPKLATFEALQVAQEVIAMHVEAGRNFMPAYKFARDKKQLGLDRSKAIEFAKQIAGLSKAQSKPDRPREPQ